MGVIYVVRHGQAAFGTDDYDRLTETGFAQARLLGEYFAKRDVHFDAVFTGTLRRQRETAQEILATHKTMAVRPVLEMFPGLDEYKADAVLSAYGAVLESAPEGGGRDPVVLRDHFRSLREALLAWTEDRTQPQGMPAWRDFQDGAVAALVEARRRFPDGHVLVVSSGGPIASMVAAALKAPAATAVELNLRIRNSSLTEFASSPRRHHLIAFNNLAHLDIHSDGRLVTYA